jgi:hypothetical protein
MVLHFMPVVDSSERVEREQEEIQLVASGPRPKPPLLRDWVAENGQQTITHVATGCQFRAYPVYLRLVEGFTTPFGPRYEIAVKFVGMKNIASCPTAEQIRELGRQGIEWVLTFTSEARRR